MDPIKCPKCKEGVMKLPTATKPLGPDYDKEGGAKLVCSECGHRANPGEIPRSEESN